MPYNPQINVQSNWWQEILAKSLDSEEISSNSVNSEISPEEIEIAEGKWQDDQNLKFIVFIDFHSKIFSSKQKRKSQKIFKSLSEHLVNRTPAQCRSHFQKIMIKFKTIAKLKKYFKAYFGEELYNKEFRELAESQAIKYPEANEKKVLNSVKEVQEIGIQTEPIIEFSLQYQHMWMMWKMHLWNMSFYPWPMNFFVQDKETNQ